jgi:hypothetical protein
VLASEACFGVPLPRRKEKRIEEKRIDQMFAKEEWQVGRIIKM